MPTLCAVLITGLVLLQDEPAPPPAGAGPTNLRPCVAFGGAHSAVTEAGLFRVTTNDEWVDLWAHHMGQTVKHPYDYGFNVAGVPQIDFERFMVIAVFQGRGQGGGYTFESAEVREGRLLLRIADHSYQTTGRGDAAPAPNDTPFGLFVLSRMTQAIHVEVIHRFIGGGSRIETLATLEPLVER